MNVFQWVAESWHKVVIGLLAMDHLYDRLLPMWEKFGRAEEYVEKRFHERRHNGMSIISEVEALMSLVPKLEKAVSDAKALEGSPQGAALIADIEAIIVEVKTLVPSTSGVTPTPPVA